MSVSLAKWNDLQRRQVRLQRWFATVLWAVIQTATVTRLAAAAPGELELAVIDAATDEPTAVQIQLVNQRGNVVRPRALVDDGGWQVFDGRTVLRLAPGRYTFRMRRGVEYRRRRGSFLMRPNAGDHHTVRLPRIVDMRQEGWWSTDLDVTTDTPPTLTARVLTTDSHPLAPVLGGGDTARPGAAHSAAVASRAARQSLRELDATLARAAAVTHQPPTSIRYAGGEVILYPTTQAESATTPAEPTAPDWLPERQPFRFVKQRIEANRTANPTAPSPHVHLTHVTCWDLPAWIATGHVNSVGILHSGIREAGCVESLRDHPRDTVMFPDPHGVALWAQHVYFQLLESGHRIIPAAGSGAGVAERQRPKAKRSRKPPYGGSLGWNRVYVQTESQTFDLQRWWSGLQTGRVLVTNGPLLRVQANGQWPGHRFTIKDGGTLSLELAVQLATQEPIRYLEVIQNGRPVQQVRLEDWKKRSGRLPNVEFSGSGWLLVRVVAESPSAFIAALSGPFYVEGSRPRISRSASQFFLDWVYRRAKLISRQPQSEESRRQRLLTWRDARDYWRGRLEAATVD